MYSKEFDALEKMCDKFLASYNKMLAELAEVFNIGKGEIK